MLVLSVKTFSVDIPRQIAADLHGSSRAHSIGNGLFNFPQEALQFPHWFPEKGTTFVFILLKFKKNLTAIFCELSYIFLFCVTYFSFLGHLTVGKVVLSD